jgi:hypothetical protein
LYRVIFLDSVSSLGLDKQEKKGRGVHHHIHLPLYIIKPRFHDFLEPETAFLFFSLNIILSPLGPGSGKFI